MDIVALRHAGSHPSRTAAADPAGPTWVIARCDRRRGPLGEHYLGLEFTSEGAAWDWIERAGPDDRRAIIEGGFRVRRMQGGGR